MKFLLKIVLLAGIPLINGIAMDQFPQETGSVVKQYQTKMVQLIEKETDDDRFVLINKLKLLGVLDLYLQYNGKVRDIPLHLTLLGERIHEVFEFYFKYLEEKYNNIS
jgi:hypothetical protein